MTQISANFFRLVLAYHNNDPVTMTKVVLIIIEFSGLQGRWSGVDDHCMEAHRRYEISPA